ncbi:hypothetical protein, partial [Prevotella disiens]|uniref:hypothetical protein n=1 Tax=Prevotella disiens TaxID=28130 RepID=UPI001B7FAE7C
MKAQKRNETPQIADLLPCVNSFDFYQLHMVDSKLPPQEIYLGYGFRFVFLWFIFGSNRQFVQLHSSLCALTH